MSAQFWFMFPVSVGVATVAMASGVEGATFFAPIFLLALGLPAEVAIGAGLITEVFGFASGVTAYVRRGLVDYGLARMLLVATVPAAVLGSWVAGFARADVLEAILGAGLLTVAASFLRTAGPAEVASFDRAIAADPGAGLLRPSMTLVTAAGEEIRYSVCDRPEGMTIAGIGALFMGMIGTGLRELNGYFLLQRCRVPSRVAVATGVLVAAVSALSAATAHLWRFVQTGGDALGTVLALCTFTVPGVLVGGQFGPLVAARISQHALERSLGALFLLVGTLLLVKVTLLR